ncbi:WD repeat-containing protein 6 [Cytospora paraplurivora]|uniref:WD repeat-containing protein 6 n=1 Tax=Cytospora paraplurivora TaxID=2898453 RepID=A0AAN9U9U9_9PEZI
MSHHVSPRLQREHVHCPITALELFRPSSSSSSPNGSPLYVLSGEDTHLRIHDAHTQRLCASVQVFSAQPIHGISLGGAAGAETLLVWGGASVAALSRAHIEDLIAGGGGSGAGDVVVPRPLSPLQVVQAPDWIYHGAISPSRPGRGAIVTAHNEVIPLHIATSTTGQEGRGRISLRLGRLRAPPSRPILYSAQVRWTGDDEVLVAAGTVFGEIIVWRCRFGAGDDDDNAGANGVEVLFVFTGHEGSIFGVDISPELVVHPESGRAVRLLASCSDDRTVRVWDISDAEARRQRLATQEFTGARETGFGENVSPSTGREASVAAYQSPRPLAVAMGHVSRIWNVRFSPESARYTSTERPARSLTLYSFGEDATAQRWRLDLSERWASALDLELPQINGVAERNGEAVPAATLTHETMSHNHSGKHVWSSALLWPMSPTSQEKTLIATGGSDGKIHLTEEYSTTTDEHGHSSIITVSGENVTSRLGAEKCLPTAHDGGQGDEDSAAQAAETELGSAVGEPFHMYTLLSGASSLATTASGRLFKGSLTGSEMAWTEVPIPQSIRDDLARYQTIRTAGPETALVGSPSGQLYLYHRGELHRLLKTSRKIADIICLPVESVRQLGFVNPQQVQSTTIPVVVTTMGSSQVRLLLLEPESVDILTHDSIVELEKGFILTAVACCQEYLVFGSRIGALLVQKWNAQEGRFHQVARLNRPGSKDAVSSITSLPPKRDVPSPYFLTTSRDGRYRVYEITRKPDTVDLSVHLRHEAVPPLGPMIEGAFFSIPTTAGTTIRKPELILCGFRSKDFIVWNETRQQELANVECGGAHRAFTYRVDPSDPEKVAFIWTKASRTCIHSQETVSQRALKSGGHGREIKAVASCGEYLATGAEDTDIRVWRYGKEGGLSCTAVIEKHTAGIQCLKWAGSSYLVSSSGNEELYVWRVTRLEESDYEGLSIACEGVYPDKTRDGDLRIMSFDVEVTETLQGGEADEVLCLSLVLSNSTLKTYRYSKTDGFTLLAEGRYTGACLMEIRHLRIAAELRDGSWEAHVLTAATDGHIAVWKVRRTITTTSAASPGTARYALVEVSRLHQSSIKALDLRPVRSPRHVDQQEQSSLAVVTGGDDNAIGHVHLEWTGEHFRAATRSLANGAHAAAITGLCITGIDADDSEGVDDGSYRVEVCTSSTDQRVKTWRLAVGRDGVGKTTLLANRYSAIADCGDLESLDEGGRVVVAGVGIEAWMV